MYFLLDFFNSSLYSKLNIYIVSVFVIILLINCVLYMVVMDFGLNVLYKKVM